MSDICELTTATAATCSEPAVATVTVRGHTPRRACEHHAVNEPLRGLQDFVLYDDGRCGIRHGDAAALTACRLPTGHDGPHGG